MTKWEAATKIVVTLASGGVQRAAGTENFDKPTIRDARTGENIARNSLNAFFDDCYIFFTDLKQTHGYTLPPDDKSPAII